MSARRPFELAVEDPELVSVRAAQPFRGHKIPPPPTEVCEGGSAKPIGVLIFASKDDEGLTHWRPGALSPAVRGPRSAR